MTLNNPVHMDLTQILLLLNLVGLVAIGIKRNMDKAQLLQALADAETAFNTEIAAAVAKLQAPAVDDPALLTALENVTTTLTNAVASLKAAGV